MLFRRAPTVARICRAAKAIGGFGRWVQVAQKREPYQLRRRLSKLRPTIKIPNLGAFASLREIPLRLCMRTIAGRVRAPALPEPSVCDGTSLCRSLGYRQLTKPLGKYN